MPFVPLESGAFNGRFPSLPANDDEREDLPRGFVPLKSGDAQPGRGFIPLEAVGEEPDTLAMPETDWAMAQEEPAAPQPRRLSPADAALAAKAQRQLGLPDGVLVPALTPQLGFRQAAEQHRRATDAAEREAIARDVAQKTGALPEVAANIASGSLDATGGNYPAAAELANQTGAIDKSAYAFDTRAEFKNAGSIERGLTKGYYGLKNQALGVHRFVADAVGADNYSAAMTKGRAANQGQIDAIGHQGDHLTRNFEGALASIVSNTPGLAIGIATGAEAVPLAMMGAQVFGDEYATGREKGLDFTNATARAGLFGAAEVIGEKLGLKDTLKAFRSLGGLGSASSREVAEAFAEHILKATAKQVPGEQLTTGVQFLADKAPGFGLNPKAGLADYLQQAGDTLTQTIMQSAMMAGGGAGIVQGHRLAFGEQPRGASAPLPARAAPLVPEVGVMSRAVNDAAAAGHFGPPAAPPTGQDGGAALKGEATVPSLMSEAAPTWPRADAGESGAITLPSNPKVSTRIEELPDVDVASAYGPGSGFRPLSPAIDDQPALAPSVTLEATPAVDRGSPQPYDSSVQLNTVDSAAHEAAASPLNGRAEPTKGQVLAGNAALGHPKVGGLDISIENPAGSVREDKANTPPTWRTEMKDHYGYFKGVPARASDKDHVDVFIKPGTADDFNGAAFIVDQNRPDGRFDEPKVILGAESMEDARATYLRNYEPGWESRIRGIKQVGMDELKTLLQDKAAFTKPQPASTARSPEVILFDDPMPDEGIVNAFQAGTNYVPFIQDTPGLNPAGDAGAPASTPDAAGTRPKPIRREDILVPFMKALGAGIYEGRVKGKNRLGFFRPKLEEVRIKRHADLETAAHELAHLIDSRVPEIRKAWNSGKDWQAIREELRGVSYDSGKIYEGFAEFVRLYMTQPDIARAKAPTFSAWFDAFVRRHEYGPAILKAQEGMTRFFAQSAIDRARSKIGDHRPLSDALNGVWDNLRQSSTDDLHGIYRMELELKAGKIEPVGAYESARLSRASHAIADGALRFGAPVKKADGSFGWKGKGLEEILKPVAEDLDDALLYFVGRSAHELMTQGREHLFTPGEISAMLELRTPEREQAFREYQQWNSTILDFAEAQGVINPEARRLWQRAQYLPFHRIGESGGFKGKPGDWSGVKALTGGTENIRDILANMTSNAAMLIDKAVKNEARQKVAALAELQGGGKFMAKIPPDARPVRIPREQVLDALMKAMGIDKSTAMAPAVAKAVKKLRAELEGSPAMLEVMQQGLPPAGGNVVAVLNAGKPTWWEVADPILYRALQAIDRQPAHWVVKALGWPKRVGQMSITLTPDFVVSNLARDTIAGAIMSRTGFKPVVDSLRGMRLRLMNDPLYREFIANGGGMSSIFLDEGRFRAKLKRFYARQGIDYRTVLDTPDKLFSALETIADAFEVSTRLGEYRRATARGENPRHAAYLGREVSTDFAARGDSQVLGFLYDTVVFLKAAVVSWDRLYRGLAHDPNRAAIATKTALLALFSVVLYLLNRDDERFRDLADWDRDSHVHFFVGEHHFRFPRAWEFGAVAAIAERTVEKTIDADPMGLGKDVVRILRDTFHLNVVPQIIAPLQEQATNRNSFTGAPIETPGMENLQPFLRAKPTTSETMKAAGMATRDLPEALQVNPVRAEALLRGYLNTWAAYGLLMSDKAFFGDKTPALRTDQLPVARRFYAQEPALHTKQESKFYDMLEEAKRLRGTLRELDHLGRSDLADEKEKHPMATEAQPLERAAKNLRAINADMLKIRRAADLSPDEKRKRLDELTVERNALFKATVQDAKQAQGAKKQAAP